MDNSQCIRLISLYRENKCLWDPNDTNYTNKGVREDAWRKISRQMNNIPTTELKKKMKSLSGGYRRERFREKQSRITGSGAEDTYKSKWFAYDEFAFMADKNDPGTTRDTLQQEESNSTTGSGERTINENALENVPPEPSEETAAQSNNLISNSTTGSGERTINENALENVPPEPSEETAAQSNNLISNSTTGSGERTINENALENVPPEPSEETAAQSNVQNTQQNVQTQKKNQNKRRKKKYFTWFRRYYDNR